MQDPIPVLLVSGQRKDHDLLSSLFSASDVVILQAFTCAEAVVIIQQYPVPVVVTDETLPDGNWTQLQSAQALSAIPPTVIVLGARKDPASWANAFAHGAFDVLFRPLDEAMLVRAVTLGHLRWNRCAERMSAREENMRETSTLSRDMRLESLTPVTPK